MTDIFKDGLKRFQGYGEDDNEWHRTILTPEEVNTLFEAFHARLKAEATLNVWPALDCQGTTDGKGKIG